MRKYLFILFLALAFVSCKEKEADYSFSKKYNASVTVATEDSEAIIDYFKTFDYFQAPSKYHGTYSDAFEIASEQFIRNCAVLDESQITMHLKEDESFGIFLVEDGSGIIAASIFFTPDNSKNNGNEK